MDKSIAVLIPVFNSLSHTKNCLNSLYSIRSNNEKISIIVIDDGSTDGTADWVGMNYPETTILKGNGNLWWSGSINLGIAYALESEFEFVLWWNNDIIPSEDYFTNLMQLIEGEDVLIGGSKIYYAGRQDIIWSMGGIFDTRTGKKYMLGMDEPDDSKFNEVVQAHWLPGMGTFIHKSVFEKIGCVDNEKFPQYHGDSDFTYRATLAGYQIKVYPQLKIWNDKSNSGLLHQSSYKQLIRSLSDIKSNYHFMKDISFYRRYATSPFAYQTLAYKYCYYLGGFIKWKLLNMLGYTKKASL